MKKTVKYGLFGLLVLSLSSCGVIIAGGMNAGIDDEKVLAMTAKYFGVEEKQIKVSNIEKQALSTTYRTIYKGTMYNCSIYTGTVKCSKPGSDYP